MRVSIPGWTVRTRTSDGNCTSGIRVRFVSLAPGERVGRRQAALDGLRSRMNEMFAAIEASTDVHARIATLAVALCRLTQTHEAELRVMMRAALDRLKASLEGGT